MKKYIIKLKQKKAYGVINLVGQLEYPSLRDTLTNLLIVSISIN